jgi:hypothetical protein
MLCIPADEAVAFHASEQNTPCMVISFSVSEGVANGQQLSRTDEGDSPIISPSIGIFCRQNKLLCFSFYPGNGCLTKTRQLFPGSKEKQGTRFNL